MPSRRFPPIACLAVAALAACSGPAGDVLPTGTLPLPLVAHGNEPFWWMRLDQDSVAFGTLGDEATFAADAVDGLRRAADGSFVFGAELAADKLEAMLVPGVVTDSMTGMPYPFAVTLRIYDREWRGVGGDPGDLLRGFPWVVLQIADQQFSAGLRPTLEFRRGDALVFATADGTTTGRWSVGGDTLQLSGFDTLSARLRDALESVDAFAITAGGELVLRSDGGVALRAVRQRS
ncbi:MAG: hypothetical protein R3F29_01675 [Planctomycetota bacterium]